MERTVESLEHLAIHQFGQPFVYRIVEAQTPLFDQHHDRSTGDGLGHGSHAEEGAARHRDTFLDVLKAIDVLPDAIVLLENDHGTGEPALVGQSVKVFGQAGKGVGSLSGQSRRKEGAEK